MDRARSPSDFEARITRSHFARNVTVGIARWQSVDKVCVDKSPRKDTERRDGKGRKKRGQIGGHTGKEVRVPRAQAAREALRP